MMKSVLTLVSGREDRVLRRIRISEIVRNPNQPRRYFDPEAIATHPSVRRAQSADRAADSERRL